MDRFDAMQAFVRVVETGSFTKAALTLHMSKTTVTQLVQQLEARLRVKLLNRTTRQVHVTADGAAYDERAVRLLVDLDDAETSLSSATAAPRGRLRVDVPSPLARMLLVPAFPELHARYPDLQIEMGVSDRMVDLIGDNVDCVIRGGEVTQPSLIARHVGDLQLGVFTWRCHPQIAAFSDTIFDSSWEFPATQSKNDISTDHDGVYLVTAEHVNAYVDKYKPQCLRHSVSSGKSFDFDFLNFKVSKGMTYERVLIIPTAPIAKFLQTVAYLEPTPASSFYVAVTRAKQSVAIVLDKAGAAALPFWRPSDAGHS